MESFNAVILAGGRSSRFGSPKANALFRRRPMLQWVVDAAAEVASEVVVVGAPGQELPYLESSAPIARVDDETLFEGPLAGLINGARRSTGQWLFALACDSPLLAAPSLRVLAEHRGGVDAVVPRFDDRLQPLVALYRREALLVALEAAWRDGQRSLREMLRRLRVRELDAATFAEAGIRPVAFRAVNTPDELAELERIVGDTSSATDG